QLKSAIISLLFLQIGQNQASYPSITLRFRSLLTVPMEYQISRSLLIFLFFLFRTIKCLLIIDCWFSFKFSFLLLWLLTAEN
ncbi:hypothetical protein LINGRAHAP2_LOCUS24592, partial [Linum grandiflorum]